MSKRARAMAHLAVYKNLSEVLASHDLASLGDAYINFAYSLALSNRTGKPSGAKVKGAVLAEALKKAELREYLPSRMSRHQLANGAEALIIHAWLNGYITLDETVATLEENRSLAECMTQLLKKIRKRIKPFLGRQQALC